MIQEKEMKQKKDMNNVLHKLRLLCTVFILCTAVLSASVSADTVEPDYSWYDITSTEFTISDVEDLVGFANIVNGKAEGRTKDTFKGKTVRLTADIDLTTNEDWTPIGSSMYDHPPNGDGTKMFEGTFDGCGNTIYGLSDSGYSLLNEDAGRSNEYSFGLFGYVYGANITNVNLSGVNINACKKTLDEREVTGSGVAALVGFYVPKSGVASVIENCHVLSGSVTASNNMGGLIGFMMVFGDEVIVDFTVRGCSNNAKVTTKARDAGGILGLAQFQSSENPSALKFEQCTNTGDVTAESGSGSCSVAGGILGQENTETYKNCRIFFIECENTGNITAHGQSSAEVHASGMGTSFYSAGPWLIAENCKNSGKITITGGENVNHDTDGPFAGGIFAHSRYATIINCKNTGNIDAPDYAYSGGYISGKHSYWIFLDEDDCKEGDIGVSSDEYSKCILGKGGKTIKPMPEVIWKDNQQESHYRAGLPDPYREGYVFVGWYTTDTYDPNTKLELGTDLDEGVTQSGITYYAKWEEGITFNSNGGTGYMEPLNIGNSITLTQNAFTRENYRFTGWNTKPDGTGDSYADGASISATDSTALYAQWESVITFNANGGTGDMDKMGISEGTSAPLNSNAFVFSNYEFAGWATSSDGSVEYGDGETIKPEGNITLYAQWRGKITFDANGGTGEMEAQEILKGQEVTLTPNTFTKTGYLFNKWAVNPDGTGTSYGDEATIPSAENMVLYANWTLCNVHNFVEEIAEPDYLKSPATTEQKAVYYKSCSLCGLSSAGKEGEATFEYGDVLEKAPVSSNSGSPSSGGTYTTMTRDAPEEGGKVSFKNSASPVEFVTVPAGIVDGQIIVSAVTNADSLDGKEVEAIFEVSITGSYPTGEETTITVELPKSELTKRGLTEADACLYHFNGEEWEKLVTTYEIDGDNIIYHGITTSFSPFALVYEIGGAVMAEEEKPVDELIEQPPVDEPLEPLPPIEDITTETPETPMPIFGILAGIGCAAVIFRRK